MDHRGDDACVLAENLIRPRSDSDLAPNTIPWQRLIILRGISLHAVQSQSAHPGLCPVRVCHHPPVVQTIQIQVLEGLWHVKSTQYRTKHSLNARVARRIES